MQAFLAGIDRTTLIGHRDCAIFLLMATYGPRSSAADASIQLGRKERLLLTERNRLLGREQCFLDCQLTRGSRRGHPREALLQATEELLAPIRTSVAGGRLQGEAKIGLRVGAVLNRYKVRKHFVCEIGADCFDYRRNRDSIDHEAALDGVYVIRTSLAQADLSASGCVRGYKALTQVKRAFRGLKTSDLQVRPIHHRLADRVRAHLLLCLLAYYVQWHMCEAWRPLLLADDELAGQRRTAEESSAPGCGRHAPAAEFPDAAGGSGMGRAQRLSHHQRAGPAGVRIRVGHAAECG